MANEVCFHLVLLDEVFVAGVIDAPVDVLGIVSRHILPVARKLDGEPRQRRLVVASQRAHDQSARLDCATSHSAEHIGVEIPRENTTGHVEIS